MTTSINLRRSVNLQTISKKWYKIRKLLLTIWKSFSTSNL